ncbi:MAG: O-methyltransferase [Bacteroidetes bacterium]|nr:O-methyltransferase [Bacteroidota bacterium]
MPDKNLEKYILAHTRGEDEVLADLYRKTHIKFVNPNMVSGHLQGAILTMISNMIAPEKILEIGTFTGYSAICLARGLKQNGCLDTIEKNDELTDFILSYFKKAGVEKQINLFTGNALDLIKELPGPYDLVFIDGDKREYSAYYNLVFEKVRPGGFIIADNVLWDGKVTDPDYKNDPFTKGIMEFNELVHKDVRIENVIFPFRDGLMMLMKKLI